MAKKKPQQGYQEPPQEDEVKIRQLVKPRTENQRKYFEALDRSTITFGIGPAGTGKTYIAVVHALKLLKSGDVNRIIITRPVVENDEEIGFLPGDMNEKMDPWVRPIMDSVVELVGGKSAKKLFEDRIIEICPLSYMRGRAQPLDEPVLTPNGYVAMGDISIGDYVIGSNGAPIKVSGVYPQGYVDTYKITFSDGSSTRCCGDHLWSVKNLYDKRYNNDYRILKTTDMLDDYINSHGAKQYEIPMLSSPVEFNKKDTSIDPYVLGFLIGDGNLDHSASITFTTEDHIIAEYINELTPSNVLVNKIKNSDIGYRVVQDKWSPKKSNNWLKSNLDKLGLLGTKSHNKFIPDDYKYNSANVRLELLRGLMDSDGSVFYHRSGNTRQQFSTSSPQLANDVMFIVQSLGGIVHRQLKPLAGTLSSTGIRYNYDAHVLDIVLPMNPFKLPRKADKWNDGVRSKRLISNIEYIGKITSQCIYVESNDHLYVTKDMIVTHNTFKHSFVIADEMSNSTPSQMRNLLTRIGEGSHMAVLGDPSQSDLRPGTINGLTDFVNAYNNYKKETGGLRVVFLSSEDIVRHQLIPMILDIYGENIEDGVSASKSVSFNFDVEYENLGKVPERF